MGTEPSCVLCRGVKMLCGRAYCPALVLSRARPAFAFRGTRLEASAPPAIYVGWSGYPNVAIGPAAPPVVGDTSVYDEPERWLERSVDEVLEMRLSLIRGVTRAHVSLRGRVVDDLRELVLSSTPVEVELTFAKPPSGRPVLDPHSPPSGPSGALERLRILGNPRVERSVEKAYGDTDLKAEEAVHYLYSAGIPVSRIQRMFSAGALGLGRRRKLVPTRWSITAVDDILSRGMIREIRGYRQLDHVLFFHRSYAKNLFAAILAPGTWGFEWMEAWFPRTVWNMGRSVSVEGDWELGRPREDYPSIGGCYYATRLAVCEYLTRIRRQAVALVVREIYEGFDVPLGVWFVRENVRRLFESRPVRLDSLGGALELLGRCTRLPLKTWLEKSRLLRMLTGRDATLDSVLKGPG